MAAVGLRDVGQGHVSVWLLFSGCVEGFLGIPHVGSSLACFQICGVSCTFTPHPLCNAFKLSARNLCASSVFVWFPWKLFDLVAVTHSHGEVFWERWGNVMEWRENKTWFDGSDEKHVQVQ